MGHPTLPLIGRLAAGRRAAWVAGLGAGVGVFCGPRWRVGWRRLLHGPPVRGVRRTGPYCRVKSGLRVRAMVGAVRLRSEDPVRRKRAGWSHRRVIRWSVAVPPAGDLIELRRRRLLPFRCLWVWFPHGCGAGAGCGVVAVRVWW